MAVDMKALVDNLSHHISCSICLEVYKDPIQLPCHHSYCLKCLKDFAGRQMSAEWTLPCPDCTEPATIPQGKIDELPRSFFINSLLDVFKIKHRDEEPVECKNCREKSNQISYCFQCCEFLCPRCLGAHNTMKELKDHHVIALRDFGEKEYQEVLERPGFCSVKNHEHKVLEFYCKRCGLPVCQCCVVVDHKGHDFYQLAEVTEKARLEIVSGIKREREKIDEASMVCQKIKEILQSMELQRAHAEKVLLNEAKQAAHRFEMKIQELNEAARRKSQQLTDMAGDISDKMEKSEKVLQTQRDVLASAVSATEILKLRSKVEKEAQEMCDRPLKPVDKIHLEYFPNEKSHKNLETSTIGEIKLKPCKCSEDRTQSTLKSTGGGLATVQAGLKTAFKVKTRSLNGKPVYCPTDVITVDINTRNYEGKRAGEVIEIVDCKNAKYIVSYVVNRVGEYKLTVRVNGKGIKGSPFLATAKQREFKNITVFGNTVTDAVQLSAPTAITVDKNGDFAVLDTETRTVNLFTGTGTFVKQFSHELLSNQLWGLTYMNDGNLLVSDAEKSKILKFSRSGEFLGTFCDEGKKRGQVSAPWGLSTDKQGNVIVCEVSTCRVQVLSQRGEPLLLFRVQDHADEEEFRIPWRCVYHKGRFLVTSSSNYSLQIFDDEGRRVNEVCAEELGSHMDRYAGVAVDKEANIIVSDENQHKLKVFDFEGKFLREFGSRGDKEAEFSRPYDITVLCDGRVVVADTDNHRIQIFE